MEPLQVAAAIEEKFSESFLGSTEYRGQVSVSVKRGKINGLVRWLHDDPDLSFDYLRDLCGVDYYGKKEPRFEVVYHLYSMKHAHAIRIKAQVPADDPSIETITSIYKGANWHERECFDLFGIRFEGHPDLRRILLPDDWEGHPLRKDYPLAGPSAENDWPGFKELLEKAERLKKHEWER